MANYVLIHGSGDVGWYWHLVEAELRRAGHNVVAPDMPVDDDTANLNDYADAVITAIDDPTNLIVVSQSYGGYVAPIVASRTNAKLIVLVAPMVPGPGETSSEMFENTGYSMEPLEDSSDLALFYHDVPHDLAVEALSKGRNQSEQGFNDRWPLEAWPNIPTRAVVGTLDRLFSVEWLSKVIEDRLGVVPDRIEAAHCVALAKPLELAQYLESCRAEAGIS